jgi:HD-GYP domain-containing protein (c-di-GMP phosphodiesterase class II)
MLEKSKLLDAFLLTLIAQIGLESAAFLELVDNKFVATRWKGFETADPDSLSCKVEDVDIANWQQSPVAHEVGSAPLADSAKKVLEQWDMAYAAPFIVYGQFRGLVLLGNSIGKLGNEAWEYLGMLSNQVAIAYAHTCRFEEERDRMLGLVHSLISMIEHNTVTLGSTEAIVNYVHALAVELHYPEDRMHDLLYGTVLRDIGMIKISDLIVRSPRELLKEEWEVIKRHPIEGAMMLEKMRFSNHTVKIVISHHERFNGEGYPDRLQGNQIPLGARIVSVVESFAAMMEDKPARPALTEEEALNTIRENWGLRYDPDVVNQFVEIIEEEIRTGRKVASRGIELLNIQ